MVYFELICSNVGLRRWFYLTDATQHPHSRGLDLVDLLSPWPWKMHFTSSNTILGWFTLTLVDIRLIYSDAGQPCKMQLTRVINIPGAIKKILIDILATAFVSHTKTILAKLFRGVLEDDQRPTNLWRAKLSQTKKWCPAGPSVKTMSHVNLIFRGRSVLENTK